MTLSKFLCFAVLTFVACSSGQQKTSITDTSQQTIKEDTSCSADIASFVQKLSNKHLTKNNHYYKLTQNSDSTFQLTWGSDSVNRIYEKDIDFFVADRLEIAWESKDFMILNYDIGSGEWKTIVLPVNKHQVAQVVENGLCFDTINNLIGVKQFNDTVLYVQNLQTQQKQFIIEKDKPCDIPNNFYCIDTIGITNKTLYYKWKASDDKIVEKRIRLTI